jgi:putative acetyltransferase
MISNPHQPTVRPAAPDDLDAVARLWHESASRMDGAPANIPSEKQLRDRIDAELASGWDLYVALKAERIVGMLALQPRDSILDQIFVAPREQGAGVGKALLALAKQEMPSRFTLRMTAANQTARSFYERQGLKPLRKGTHPRTGVPVVFFTWSPD